MYPTSPTHTEELLKIIEDSAETSDKLPNTTILQKMIDKHAVERDKMLEGVAYYLNQADIKKRNRYFYEHGTKKVDTEKPNNRISHNWHKLLVQQKVQYILGKPITFNAEDETFLAVVNDFIDEDFDDCMQELLKTPPTRVKSGFIHLLMKKVNLITFAFQQRKSYRFMIQQKRSLLYAIRYYDVKNIDDEITRKVELYTDEQIFYYVEHNGSLIQDFDYKNNPESHFYDTKGKGYGWGKVPMIEFKNNEEGVSDLIFYKDLIDQYNNNISNNANTFDEMQDLIYV